MLVLSSRSTEEDWRTGTWRNLSSHGYSVVERKLKPAPRVHPWVYSDIVILKQAVFSIRQRYTKNIEVYENPVICDSGSPTLFIWIMSLLHSRFITNKAERALLPTSSPFSVDSLRVLGDHVPKSQVKTKSEEKWLLSSSSPKLPSWWSPASREMPFALSPGSPSTPNTTKAAPASCRPVP